MTEEKKKKRKHVELEIEENYAKRVRRDCTKEGVAKTGQIMKLSVTNFMDYDEWEISFNSNINIFNSEDLSVENTIRHALFLGLGAKQNRLGRGMKLKEYVKNTESPAYIRITLCNNQQPPYSVDFVTVVCIISGSTNFRRQFKLVDDEGNTVSNEMNANNLLEDVKSNMRIRFDHPAVMMSQNESMEFVFSTAPETMYEDFTSASDTSTFEPNHPVYNTLKWKINEKQKHSNSLSNEIAQLQEAKKKKESTAADRKKLENMKKQLRQVMVMELEKGEGNVEKLEKEVAEDQNQKQEMEKKIEKSTEELQQCEAEIERKAKKLAEARSSLASIIGEYTRKYKERLNLQTGIKMMKEDWMKDQKQRDEIDQLQNNICKIDARLQEMKKREVELTSDIKRVRELLGPVEHKIADFNTKIYKMTQEEDRLKQMRDNPATIYGRNMPELLNAIEESIEMFRHRPRGPLGLYVKLKDPNWAAVVEEHVGRNMLRAFYVDNSQDRTTLRNIMKRYFSEENIPHIICNRFHDRFFELPCEQGYENLLNMLGITDPIVANYLKDHPKRFNLVLLKNTTQTDVVTRPRHCIRVLNKQGVTIYPGSEPRRYELPEAEFLKPMEVRLEEMKNQRSSAMEKWRNLAKQRDDYNHYLEEKNEKFHQIKDSIEKDESSRRDISDYMNTLVDEISQPGTWEEYVTKMDNLVKKIADNEIEESCLTVEIEKIWLARNRYEGIMHGNSFDSLKHECDKIRKSIADDEKKLHEVREACKSKEQNLREVQKVVENLKADIVKQNFTVEMTVPDDNEMNPQRSSAELGQEIKQLEEHITAAEKQQDTDIDADLEATSKEHEETVQSVSELKAKLENMKQTQEDVYNYTVKDACNTLKREFGRLLAKAKLEDNLIIDSKERVLRVSRMSLGAEKKITKHLNLSDCQKLYYSMAFVLAFWKCMSQPFFIINNFNFPMERNMENVATEIVLEHLKTNPDRQFIVFKHFDNLRSISEDHITYHKPPVPQVTPGTSSQSDQ